MAEGNRFSPLAKSFTKEIGQGTVNSTDAIGQSTANMTDEEIAILKRLVEKRSREAAHVTVTPVSAVQHCIPRSLNPEMPPDVCVSLESSEGKVDPERDELESPSAGTGFETPGQQCHPIWETGQTTADGFLTAGVGSKLGGRHLFTHGTRGHASRHQKYSTCSIKNRFHTNKKQTPRQEDMQRRKQTVITWWGRRRAATAMERGCNGSLFFSWGGRWAWGDRCLCFVFFFCLLCSLFILTIRQSSFQRAEKHERRRGSSR